MEKHQENIVPAVNQNKKSVFLFPGSGMNILFVGNSITRHGIKPEIGWHRECGMAASCLENDYVHRLMAMVRALFPAAGYGIAQVANFERGLEDMDVMESYRDAAEFQADIILMFFGANVPREYVDQPEWTVRFGEAYERMRNFLNPLGNALVVHGEGFYYRPTLDAEKMKVARKYGDLYVSMEKIREKEENFGEFHHPSDQGMLEIAQEFFREIEPIIRHKMQK